MRRTESIAGRLVRIVVALFCLYLIFSVVYAAVGLLHSGGATIGGSVSSSEDTALSPLASVSFEDSNARSELLNLAFWNATLKASGQTAAERIDLFCLSLKDNGFTPNQIDDKVSGLVQATDNAANDSDVGEAADEVDYSATATIIVKINSDHEAYLSKNDYGEYFITQRFLLSVDPSLVPGAAAAFKISVHKKGNLLSSYHLYQGGKYFAPTLPEGHVSPGDVVAISIEVLSQQSFIDSLVSFGMRNSGNLRWMSDISIADGFSILGDSFQIHFSEDNRFVDEVQDFTIKGTVDKYPGPGNQLGGVYLQFSVPDYAGRTAEMRILYAGSGSPTLQIDRGAGIETVSMVSYDGYRLSVVYGGSNSVSTIYLRPPSETIYSLSGMRPYSGPLTGGLSGMYTKAYVIDDVGFNRGLEQGMFAHGFTTDLGRLGSEIAYVIGVKDIGLDQLQIQEPNQGGRDLYTSDGSVAIQARLLKSVSPAKYQSTIQAELLNLLGQLDWDFYHNTQMTRGYGVLTFPGTGGSLQSIVLEVRRA